MVAFLAKIRLFTHTAVATERQVAKHTDSGEETQTEGNRGREGPLSP